MTLYDDTTIRRLIGRFMAGETSLEEERLMAEWFRRHPDAGGDLAPYRQMFDYFGQGMPQTWQPQAGAGRKPGPAARASRVLALMAAAAAVALLAVLAWPEAERPQAGPRAVATTRPAPPAKDYAGGTPTAPAMPASGGACRATHKKAPAAPAGGCLEEDAGRMADEYLRQVQAEQQRLMADVESRADSMRHEVDMLMAASGEAAGHPGMPSHAGDGAGGPWPAADIP